MTTPTDEITEQDMRVLLEEMRQWSNYYQRLFTLAGELALDDAACPEWAAPWFVVACQEFLESGKVREAGLGVESSSGWKGNSKRLIEASEPFVELYDQKKRDTWIFTGPHAQRWVRSAIHAAKILREVRG